jgi:uncharacterized protein YqgC (DUF456 family)
MMAAGVAGRVALWIVAGTLMAAGFIGTIIPGMPGVLVIYAGMWLAAWIDDFARIGWRTLTLLGVLTALAFAADLIASVLGARRVGASRQAIIGSLIGGIVGLFFGPLGLLFGPFAGAVAGELCARRPMADAARVGLATWIGLLIGTMAKIALAVTMLGVFLTSYWW